MKYTSHRYVQGADLGHFSNREGDLNIWGVQSTFCVGFSLQNQTVDTGVNLYHISLIFFKRESNVYSIKWIDQYFN